MVLYVRKAAWLNTVAEKQAEPRIAVYKRREEAGQYVSQLEMPDLLGFEYIVEYLFEAGPVGNNGFGPEPITWIELEAWAKLTQVDLDSWEASTLRKLSEHYSAQLVKSADPKCRPPGQEEQSREQIAADVEAFFDRMEQSDEDKWEQGE